MINYLNKLQNMRTILYSLLGMLLLASCSTIEDRDNPGSILTKDQLKIEVINPNGSNSVVLKNLTPDVIMFFDYGTGTTHRAIDTIYIPFAGTFKLKYTAFCAGGTITDSTTFTIAKNDAAFFDKDKAWKGLTGGGAGQTWVYALDFPGGIIAGNGPENCLIPGWWTMNASGLSGQLKAPSSLNDEVYMDITGAAHFNVKHADGSIVKGFFNVIAPYVNGGVSYSGIETLGVSFPWPNSGKYHFTVMNANALSVHDYAAYNIALYKRKGFSY